MVRQLQEDEPMQNITVRMPGWLVADIDAYRTTLKAQNRAFRVERGEAVRDLLLKALALVADNGPTGPRDAGGGPIEAPGTLREDRSDPEAAQPQAHQRTTVRTRRKRQAAAQEG